MQGIPSNPDESPRGQSATGAFVYHPAAHGQRCGRPLAACIALPPFDAPYAAGRSCFLSRFLSRFVVQLCAHVLL